MTTRIQSRFHIILWVLLMGCLAAAWFFRESTRSELAWLQFNSAAAPPAGATHGRNSFNGFDISNSIIPIREILSGGPGRDGIPSIDQPKFISPSAAEFMLPKDLVISVTIDGQTRAYPLRILVWHEIVNDELGGRPIAVTYCPLCGTAMVFDRKVGGRTLTFGVSGMLYQSDVLMFDRETESLWSQLAMTCVSGAQVNTQLHWLPSQQLTWSAWEAKYPKGAVLSTQIGAQRNYSSAAYLGYERSPDTMFPESINRTDLPTKGWVVGIIVDGVAHAYPMHSLPANHTIRDQVNQAVLDMTFDPASQQVAIRRRENGEIVPYVKVYWFAWQAFYPETGIWKP